MPPRISVIVPARNEARSIEACVRSIFAQGLDSGMEVLVADGGSSDDTARLARSAGATVVENPHGTTPAGLNAALAAAQGSIIVRFDAHGRMPPGYVEASVRALDEEIGAVGVGGWVQVEATGPWGRATGAVLGSRFGIGNARSWRRPRPTQGRVDVDTFPLGCWHAESLRAAGGWDERFLRNQDFELNYRLRTNGGRIIFDPAVWSYYRPRESLGGLARQYWDYGRFKALTVATAPGSLRPRQVAPVLLLATATTAALPTDFARAARGALVAYGLVVTVVAATSRGGWRTVPVLVTIHGVWGAGLLAGLSNLAGRSILSRLRSTWTSLGLSERPSERRRSPPSWQRWLG
jgi:glycosyltransferase involved in cell wall biosynthesis